MFEHLEGHPKDSDINGNCAVNSSYLEDDLPCFFIISLWEIAAFLTSGVTFLDLLSVALPSGFRVAKANENKLDWRYRKLHLSVLPSAFHIFQESKGADLCLSRGFSSNSY